MWRLTSNPICGVHWKVYTYEAWLRVKCSGAFRVRHSTSLEIPGSQKQAEDLLPSLGRRRSPAVKESFPEWCSSDVLRGNVDGSEASTGPNRNKASICRLCARCDQQVANVHCTSGNLRNILCTHRTDSKAPVCSDASLCKIENALTEPAFACSDVEGCPTICIPAGHLCSKIQRLHQGRNGCVPSSG